jgi:hypothetical protein
MNSKLIIAALLSLIALQVSQIEPSASAQEPEKTEQGKQTSTSADAAFSEAKWIWKNLTVKRNTSGNNELVWFPASAQSESFLVQRSVNGRSFRTIGRRSPNENIASYSFEDVGFKKDAYYRIIEVSVDGKISYSAVVRTRKS